MRAKATMATLIGRKTNTRAPGLSFTEPVAVVHWPSPAIVSGAGGQTGSTPGRLFNLSQMNGWFRLPSLNEFAAFLNRGVAGSPRHDRYR